MLFENRRSLLGVRNLVPLCVLALITAPIPAPLAPIPTAHAQNQLWITQFGTSSSDYAYDLSPDGEGGTVVGGWTFGNLGGPNAGRTDAFLARFDSAGNQLWIRQFGTSAIDRAIAVAPDGAGGVMVAGHTDGSLGGPNAGVRDAFLARYDSAGNQVWISQFGTSFGDTADALASDGAGGVMIAGYTGGNLGAPIPDPGPYLARYDSSGNRLWTRQFGGNAGGNVRKLSPDGSGGVMIVGDTNGNLGGPNAGPIFTKDVFLARYDGAGNQLWIRQFGTSSNDYAYDLAPDEQGGVVVAGYTEDSLGGVSAGRDDAFLARYDGAGNRLWIRQFGTSSDDGALAVSPDGSGGVIVAGVTRGSMGGPFAGGLDIFLARYGGAGNQLWMRQFGSSSWDFAEALAPDGAGGVMLAGETQGSFGGPNAGEIDFFLARYEIDSCPCACDFDTSTGAGVCDLIDFTTFAGQFATGDPCACDLDTSTGSGVCDLVDFTTFAGQFAAGCP